MKMEGRQSGLRLLLFTLARHSVSICDKDQDASFSRVSWGPGTRKARSSARLGDILLVSADDDTGKVRGRLAAATKAELLSASLD